MRALTVRDKISFETAQDGYGNRIKYCEYKAAGRGGRRGGGREGRGEGAGTGCSSQAIKVT
jgi:hypothetical protein